MPVLKRADALYVVLKRARRIKAGQPVSKLAARFKTVRVAKRSVTYTCTLLNSVAQCAL